MTTICPPASVRELLVVCVLVVVTIGCSNSPSSAPTPPASPSARLQVTFDQNPVPFRSSGCSFSMPSGWYTSARVQETAGVALAVTTLTQKLDGATVSFLTESFDSRFGACAGLTFTPGMILAGGAACGTVGACTDGNHSTYQFSLAGTDANGHTISFDTPVLQLGARPAGQVALAHAAPSAPMAPASAPIVEMKAR